MGNNNSDGINFVRYTRNTIDKVLLFFMNPFK